jgi:T-complex protein 1 subunit epsilon
LAINRLEEISRPVDIFENEHENLVRTAMTALGSKIVSKCKRKLAEISVKAVLSVAD